MEFVWDENKNRSNLKKHKIAFEDAIPVFFDEHAIAFEDDRFDYQDGQRMIIIGANKHGFCMLRMQKWRVRSLELFQPVQPNCQRLSCTNKAIRGEL